MCHHFAASRNPSNHGDRVAAPNSLQNVATVAKSFLSEAQWSEYLRKHPGGELAASQGAVAANRALLDRLHCSRNYTWLRDNAGLMSRVESYDSKDLVAMVLMHGERCVHLEQANEADTGLWELRECDPSPDTTAFIDTIRLTRAMELRTAGRAAKCVDQGILPVPLATNCHYQAGNQLFRYSLANRKLKFFTGLQCLTANSSTNVVAWTSCQKGNEESQQFHWRTVFHPELIA